MIFIWEILTSGCGYVVISFQSYKISIYIKDMC